MSNALGKGAGFVPGLITNYLFGERCFHALSPNHLKNIINAHPNAYRVGLQGPNIFFYYLSCRARRRPNNICHVLHEKHTGPFIGHMLDYMELQDDEGRAVCAAYIAGFLCHYSLDTHTHPYITWRYSADIQEHPELLKRSFYYQRLETYFDVLLLRRFNHMSPEQLNLEALVNISKKERHAIADCLLYALRHTYRYHISRKTLNRILLYLRKTCVFLQSNPQMRRRLSGFAEKHLHRTLPAACFIYPEFTGDPRDYLNEAKNPWTAGVDGPASNASFFELLNDANDYGQQLLDSLDDYLAWNGSRQHLMSVIGNNSYYTGQNTA